MKDEAEKETAYWSLDINSAIKLVDSDFKGLKNTEAERRKMLNESHTITSSKRGQVVRLLAEQFKSPITIILILAAVLSYFLGDRTNAVIIIGIVFCGNGLSFWQEYATGNAVAKLLDLVRVTAAVLREINSYPVKAG